MPYSDDLFDVFLLCTILASVAAFYLGYQYGRHDTIKIISDEYDERHGMERNR